MKTKGDLVADCFSMLLRTGVTIQSSTDDNELALNRLEDIMAELESRNMITGYNFEDNPQPDSPSGLENWMNQAVSLFLAKRVWPDFAPEEVNPALAVNATTAMSNLCARLAQVKAVDYAGRMPLGSGNQPWQQYRKFYGAYRKGGC